MTTSQERIIQVSDITGAATGQLLLRLANILMERIPHVTNDEMTKGTIVALRLTADMLEASLQVEATMEACEKVSKAVFEANRPFHLADVERTVPMQ